MWRIANLRSRRISRDTGQCWFNNMMLLYHTIIFLWDALLHKRWTTFISTCMAVIQILVFQSQLLTCTLTKLELRDIYLWYLSICRCCIYWSQFLSDFSYKNFLWHWILSIFTIHVLVAVPNYLWLKSFKRKQYTHTQSFSETFILRKNRSTHRKELDVPYLYLIHILRVY